MAKQNIKHLNEQFKRWFCEYGSYVVLHRAVPHIDDGLKPSQRRVLHSLKEKEDGRYNKVAEIVGNTMKYHPHGDCIKGNTKLFLLNGEKITIEEAYNKKIESLEVLCHNELTGKIEKTVATHIRIGQLAKETYIIETTAGKIETTGNHPFLVVDKGFVKAEELKESQYIQSAVHTIISDRSYIKPLGEDSYPLHVIEKDPKVEHAKTGVKGETVYSYERIEKDNITHPQNGIRILSIKKKIYKEAINMYDFTIKERENMYVDLGDGALICIHNSSINETLVGLAQKNFLIDKQGNWGNLLTGDGAAAGRYIEARLTPFAKDVIFNSKTTEWAKSYDGRNEEPVTLPVKFPLLLAQGTEGIAVSLACKILPHNFLEICDASIAHLKGESFSILPDFPQGGEMDASGYLDGNTGGKVKIRATIIPHGKHGLEITAIPFGTTTLSLRDSIIDAEAKGKIKIKKIHDMTSDSVSLIIELASDADQETTKQALYAFTECETSHNTIGVVIKDSKPEFVSVTYILKHNVDRTKFLIKRELEILLEELYNKWHKLNIERIFIETKAYLQLEDAKSQEEGIQKIKRHMTPHLTQLRREVSQEDFETLTEIKIRRISKYDITAFGKEIEAIEKNERDAKKKLKYLKETTIEHFELIKSKYGEDRKRKTKISNNPFGKIEASEVALTNQKIYWDKEGGFIGTGLKKSELLPFEVNELIDVIGITAKGVMKVNRPGEKTFYGESLLDARPINKTKDAPIYSLIYEDNKTGKSFAKRFQINSGFTRDRVYHLCGGEENKVLFFHIQENNNGKQPQIKVKIQLTKDSGARKKEIDFDFTEIAIKNRESQGNLVAKYKIEKCS